MKNPFSNLFKKKDLKSGEANPAPTPKEKKKKSGFFDKFLKNRLGKSAVQGEEIVGVELTANEIRLAQLSSNKSNQWVLDKFFIHEIKDIPDNSSVLENQDKIGDELKIALQRSKISTTNAAIVAEI